MINKLVRYTLTYGEGTLEIVEVFKSDNAEEINKTYEEWLTWVPKDLIRKVDETKEDILAELTVAEAHELKKAINKKIIDEDTTNNLHSVITEIEKYEFEMIEILEEGILFQRLIDDKDYMVIKSSIFDEVIGIKNPKDQ